MDDNKLKPTNYVPTKAGMIELKKKYVDYQNNEVAEYSDYLNALNLIDTSSRLDILFFEDKYFG
jgi:hypothetical protein